MTRAKTVTYPEQKLTFENLIAKLDALDQEHFFGPCGWREYLDFIPEEPNERDTSSG